MLGADRPLTGVCPAIRSGLGGGRVSSVAWLWGRRSAGGRPSLDWCVSSYKEWMDKHKIEGSFAAMGEEPEQADAHTARGRGWSVVRLCCGDCVLHHSSYILFLPLEGGSAAAWQRSRGGRRRVRGEEMGEERGSRNEGAWRGRARGRGRGGRGRGRGAKVAVGGLKTTSEILQTRKRKEFQQMRRRQNVKKQRGGTSGGRRSGRGRPR